MSIENTMTIVQSIGHLFDNNVYIKREDLIPFSFGGNKARKAELFFEDLERKKCNHVITYGSSSSNHCRVISNKAATLGIKCTIISPEENKEVTTNSKLMKLFNAKIVYAPLNDIKNTIDREIEKIKNDGEIPYFIPGGGHGNIGTQAYVNCFEEILDYENQNNMRFDYIFHASGTGTTQAGLIAGAYINKSSDKIVGISIARKNPYGFDVVKQSVVDYFEEKNIAYTENIFENYIFDDSYIFGSYGEYNHDIISIIEFVMRKYGIPLNTTYSGKAFYGMREFIKKHNIKEKNILFINTGGSPLFFDHIDELGEEI